METSKTRRPKHKGSGRIFENPILEKLTRTHIAAPLVLFTAISSGLIYFGIFEKGFTTPEMILLFFAGLLLFTLFEYLMHRYVYHMRAHNHVVDDLKYKMHGMHHDYPKDKMRLAMPPILSLALAVFFFILYRALMGEYVFGFLAGFLMGYTLYLGVHYSVHIFKVPDNFLKTLWHHHAIHHYRQPDRAFGVSSPLWDYVFGTMPKLRKDRGPTTAAAKNGEYIDKVR